MRCYYGQETQETQEAVPQNETKKKQRRLDPKLLDDKADWGTFYDPKDIFCGKYDCYKILGFDFRTFYTNRPTTKEITKNYRALSRHWHPDKNSKKGAKERFVKIARAYEVLINKETRDEYDFYRDRPDEYFKKYGSSVLWTYAPKSNTAAVVIGLLALLSWITIWIKKRRWRTIADHLIKAAVENWNVKEGGSSESIDIRAKAIAILEKQQAAAATAETNGDKTDTANGKTKKKKEKGVDKKGKKETDDEALKPIIVELVEAIDDFGGGYAKPTWKDMFVVQLAKSPFYFVTSLLWWSKFGLRRLAKKDYNDEELEFFTRRAVGDIIWDTLSVEERKALEKRELWKVSNFQEWKEEEEIKTLSTKEQKIYLREKKKEGRKGGKGEKAD